jgi:hypothetical protein
MQKMLLFGNELEVMYFPRNKPKFEQPGELLSQIFFSFLWVRNTYNFDFKPIHLSLAATYLEHGYLKGTTKFVTRTISNVMEYALNTRILPGNYHGFLPLMISNYETSPPCQCVANLFKNRDFEIPGI